MRTWTIVYACADLRKAEAAGEYNRAGTTMLRMSLTL